MVRRDEQNGLLADKAMTSTNISSLVERLEFIANHTGDVLPEEMGEVCDEAAEVLHTLSIALKEALDGWDDWSDSGYKGGDEDKERIAELRKEFFTDKT